MKPRIAAIRKSWSVPGFSAVGARCVFILLFLTTLFPLRLAAQTVQTFNSSGTWTVPAGVYAVTVEAWGGGGGGATNGNQGGGGGGGGAYASATVIIVPGTTYSITVGSGGAAGTAGGASQFDTGTVVRAAGGSAASGGTGGAGGTTVASVGTTKYAGGSGGAGQQGGGAARGGGGGGGSATASANGGTGSAGSGGVGGSGGSGTGAGGTGGNDGSNGQNGSAPGGGGGGTGRSASTAGSGANGRVTLSYASVIAEFRFDESNWNGTSSEVLDSSANAYAGTAAGLSATKPTTADTTPAIPGSPGTCRYGSFTRANKDYVALPASFPNLGAGGNPFTITAWIRTTNRTLSGQRIFIDDQSNTQGFGLSLGDGGAGVVRFYSRGTPSRLILDTGNVIASNNTWYFVAAVADVPSKIKRIYVYSAAGAQLANVSSTPWTEASFGSDAGPASIGGETNASGEGSSSFGFSGNIDEVTVFGAALSQGAIEAQLARTHACASAGPNHIRIEHAGSGVTCAPTTLTIKACTDALCSSLYSGGVTGMLTATGTPTVNWVGGANFAIGAAGLVTKDVQVTTAGNVVWGASSVAPAATSGTPCFIGATENCSFASALAGFLFDVPNHLSDTTQTIAVSAVKQSDSSLACTPAFASTSKTVNFNCGYSDPASGTLPVAVGGSNITCGSTGGVSLAFDATGVATTTVRYADVGQMSLTASYTGTSGSETGLVMTGSDDFIAAPASFTVVPSGPYEAGTPFSVTVTAKNASGATTLNFGKESTTENVTLSHALVGPAGGNDPVLEGTTTLADASFAAGNGVASAADIEWDEVGDINLTATLASASYLGSGLSATGSAAAGPFKPAYFTTAVTPGTGSFTYAGQPFTVNVTAMNADGVTTQNYEGAYAKAVTLTDANSATNNSGTLGAFSNATVAAASFTGGVATATTIKYDFTTKTTAPLEAPGSLPLKLRATDTDGVTSNFGATPVEGTTPIRAGRLRLVNFYGSELLAPRVEYRAEYWDGNRWTVNMLDSATAIVAGNIATGGLTVGTIGALTNGVGFINFATAAAGSYDIAFNLNASGSDTSCNTAHGGTAASKPWLQGYWSGSCGGTPAWRQDPGARVRLGSPKAPYIYLRERY